MARDDLRGCYRRFSLRLPEQSQSLAPNPGHALDTAIFGHVISHHFLYTIVIIIIILFLLLLLLLLLALDRSIQGPRAASLGQVPDSGGQFPGRDFGPHQGGGQVPQGPGKGPPLSQARTKRGPHLIKLHVVHQPFHQRRPFRIGLGAQSLDRRPLPRRLVPANAFRITGETNVVIAHVIAQDLSREPHGLEAERERGREAVGAGRELGLVIDVQEAVEMLLEGRLTQVLDTAMAGFQQGPAALAQVHDGGGALPVAGVDAPLGADRGHPQGGLGDGERAAGGFEEGVHFVVLFGGGKTGMIEGDRCCLILVSLNFVLVSVVEFWPASLKLLR
ncbi:hypothetical protein PG996_014382 [Apiospora saccharicola]|uniref:Uncharacterized protein n=1 Tax=Apiospora saccharicola TaxID=335842 RepID=A0ABR1TI58_9PEZI